MVISVSLFPPWFLARQDLADLGVDILGQEHAFGYRNIHFAGVYCLGQIVHNNFALLVRDDSSSCLPLASAPMALMCVPGMIHLSLTTGGAREW